MSRDLQLNIRIDSKAQLERWRAAATRDKRTLSDWIRLTLDQAAATDTSTALDPPRRA